MVHFHHLFHDSKYKDDDSLIHGALLNTLLWAQSHNFIDILNDLKEYPILACIRVLPSGRITEDYHFCVLQSTSLQTYRHSSMSHHSRTRTFLDHFHWVIYPQHQLVAFVNSRVC